MSTAFAIGSAKPVVLRSSFAGAAVTSAKPQRCASTPTASYVPDGKFGASTYQKLNDTAPSVAPQQPSQPSKWWVAYRETLKENFSPFGTPQQVPPATPSQAALRSATTPFFMIYAKGDADKFGKGGDPAVMINTAPAQVADNYMATCITTQYKQSAAPYGTYEIQCTEGTVKGQAEESRNLSLSSAFRLKQRSTAQKFGDFTETRRKAIIASHGCSYEEALVDKYPVSASAMVRGYAESKGVCVRYAVSSDAAESYMADCVDKQSKFRSVPFGTYDVLCCDGNAKSVPEYKRVSALSARFRAKQLPQGAKEALKYESAKYARNNFGHGCSYEETYFNNYAAVAASMRPASARY